MLLTKPSNGEPLHFSNPYINPQTHLTHDLTLKHSIVLSSKSMARHVPPPQTQPFTLFHLGLAAASLLLFGLAAFMCASHSRKLRRWAACYDSGDHEPVIQLNNEMMLMMDNSATYDAYNGDPSTMLSGDQRRVPLWQKNILMGGKCHLPDYSGIILYDSEGKVVASPAKNSHSLLTWK